MRKSIIMVEWALRKGNLETLPGGEDSRADYGRSGSSVSAEVSELGLVRELGLSQELQVGRAAWSLGWWQ